MGTLRFVLALSVICAHGGGLFGYDMATGRGAVQIFFMLSGFLMQLVLAERYDPRRDLFLFYSNRALRIYPTYFFALIFALAVAAALARHSTGFFVDLESIAPVLTTWQWLKFLLSSAFIFGQDVYVFQQVGSTLHFTAAGVGNAAELLLVIPPAWSISLELMFYLAAPFLARLQPPTLLWIMVGSLALRAFGWSLGLDHDPWTYRFFPFEILLFVAGMVSYRCGKAILAMFPARLLPAALPLVVISVLAIHPTLLVGSRLGLPADVVYFPFYVLMFVLLPVLFSQTKASRLDNRLGSYSFPVYLLHWSVIQVYNTYFTNAGSNHLHATVRTVACAAITLVVSYGAIVLIEVPLEALRRRRTRASRSGQGGAVATQRMQSF